MSSEKSVSEIQVKSDFLRGEWLVGFGWDHHQWSDSRFPHRKTLDQYFPDRPVFFSRVDGHSSWINSRGMIELEKKGYDFNSDILGGQIHRDTNGFTGILSDQAHIKALLLLPSFSDQQIKKFCLTAMKNFNQGGFTHIRDLSMTSHLWKILCKIQKSNQQTVCIDSFITAESVTDLDRSYAEYSECKKNLNPYLRIHGVKIFVDGSLGSKTAFISRNYLNENHCGILSWSESDIQKAIEFCWSKKIAIAIHVIGDQAVHSVAKAARSASAAGFEGKIHLEHVQILRSETLALLKPLHVEIHMQPCHWLNDHVWLNQILPQACMKNLFQWQRILKNKIPLHFGSDSPIEKSSLINTIRALKLSQEFKIPKLDVDWKPHHAHPDPNWTISKTILNDDRIIEVIFDGQKII